MNYDRGEDLDQILDAQHGVVWIPQGYPGEGNILLYNNRHSINNSSVIEIIPDIDIEGNYILDELLPFGPEIYDWIYQESFYSLNQSGVFRLYNGNTLITVSAQDRIIEVTPNGDIVWEYNYNEDGFIPRAIKYSEYYLIPYDIGDINIDGDIDIVDIILISDFILNNIFPNEHEFLICDINLDGMINIYDIILLVNIILFDAI